MFLKRKHSSHVMRATEREKVNRNIFNASLKHHGLPRFSYQVLVEVCGVGICKKQQPGKSKRSHPLFWNGLHFHQLIPSDLFLLERLLCGFAGLVAGLRGPLLRRGDHCGLMEDSLGDETPCASFCSSCVPILCLSSRRMTNRR